MDTGLTSKCDTCDFKRDYYTLKAKAELLDESIRNMTQVSFIMKRRSLTRLESSTLNRTEIILSKAKELT